jgi:hypothetical protein
MATTVSPKPSLLEEFQSLLKLIKNDHPLTCHGRTKKNERCKSRVGKGAKKRLSALCFDVAECLKNGCEGIEVLLQEASSLAMCIRMHQLQATDKYKTWMAMVPLTTDKPPLDDTETKVSISKLKCIIAYFVISQRSPLRLLHRLKIYYYQEIPKPLQAPVTLQLIFTDRLHRPTLLTILGTFLLTMTHQATLFPRNRSCKALQRQRPAPK